MPTNPPRFFAAPDVGPMTVDTALMAPDPQPPLPPRDPDAAPGEYPRPGPGPLVRPDFPHPPGRQEPSEPTRGRPVPDVPDDDDEEE